MIRGRNRLFGTALRSGGIGGLGAPPSGETAGGTHWEMDWESGGEAVPLGTGGGASKTPGTSTGGGSYGLAPDPWAGSGSGGTAPAGGGAPASGTAPSGMPSGAWVDQLGRVLNQAGQVIGAVRNIGQQGASFVAAVSGQSAAPAPAATFAYAPAAVAAPVNAVRLRRTTLPVARLLQTTRPVTTQATSDAGLLGGMDGQTIGLIAGVAVAAGLGYYLLTGKKKSRK